MRADSLPLVITLVMRCSEELLIVAVRPAQHSRADSLQLMWLIDQVRRCPGRIIIVFGCVTFLSFLDISRSHFTAERFLLLECSEFPTHSHVQNWWCMSHEERGFCL
jgi:hypothetical protein